MKKILTAIVLILALGFWGAFKSLNGNDVTYLHVYRIPSGFGYYEIFVVEDTEGARVVPLTTHNPKRRPFM